MKPLETAAPKQDSAMEKKHKCASCPFSTNIMSNFKQHVIVHSDEKPFKCPECPFKGKSKRAVQVHFKNVHQPESRPFPCPESGCNFAAKIKSNLKTHLKVHSNDTPEFSCSHPNCSFSTKYKSSLIKHTRVHTGEKSFVCQFESCSYATAVQWQLVVHTRTHTKERPFKCTEPNCGYSAALKSQAKKHALIQHPKEGAERPSFPCSLCEYKGKSKGNLTAHMNRHTLEKKYECSFESCAYRCKHKSSLFTHMKTHSDERQYKCELCPFRGKTRTVVVNHLKYIHSDDRPFKCTEPKCNFAAKTKPILNVHLLIHTGEKNHSCSFPNCDYRAAWKNNVKSHEYFMHNSEKRVKCRICNYKCKVNAELLRHMRTHTKEEPYFCTEPGCQYRARVASQLQRHKKNFHSQI